MEGVRRYIYVLWGSYLPNPQLALVVVVRRLQLRKVGICAMLGSCWQKSFLVMAGTFWILREEEISLEVTGRGDLLLRSSKWGNLLSLFHFCLMQVMLGAGLSACLRSVGGTVEGYCCCSIPPDKVPSLLRSPDTNAESTSLSVNKGQTCNLRNGLIKAQISMEKYGSNIKEPHKTNWPRVWQNPEVVNSYCFLYWGKEVCTCFNNRAFKLLE